MPGQSPRDRQRGRSSPIPPQGRRIILFLLEFLTVLVPAGVEVVYPPAEVEASVKLKAQALWLHVLHARSIWNEEHGIEGKIMLVFGGWWEDGK